jgi:hypothetical protein
VHKGSGSAQSVQISINQGGLKPTAMLSSQNSSRKLHSNHHRVPSAGETAAAAVIGSLMLVALLTLICWRLMKHYDINLSDLVIGRMSNRNRYSKYHGASDAFESNITGP